MEIKKHTPEISVDQRINKIIYWDKEKWKHNKPKPMTYSKSNSKRDVHNDKHLYKQRKRISYKQPNFISQGIKKGGKKLNHNYKKEGNNKG